MTNLSTRLTRFNLSLFKFFFLSLILTFSFSCNDEIDNQISEDNLVTFEEGDSDEIVREVVETRNPASLQNVINNDGILEFTDWDHYKNVVDELKERQEIHLDAFEEMYPNLTNSELDDKEEEVGFVYYQPLIDFENALNFESLRAKVEAEIIIWLDNDELDFSTSPNRLAGHSVEVRTVLNEDYQVKVGGQIYDLTTLNLFSDSTPDLNKSMSDCWSFAKGWDDKEYVNDKKWEVFLEYDSWPFVMKTHGEITHYSRNRKGKWRRSRADLKINVGGRTYKEDCTNVAPISYFKKDSKRRKSLDVRVHIFSGRQIRAKDNEIISNFEVNGYSGFIALP